MPRTPERVHQRCFCERLQPRGALAVLRDIEVPPCGSQGSRAKVHVCLSLLGDLPRACAPWPTPTDDNSVLVFADRFICDVLDRPRMPSQFFPAPARICTISKNPKRVTLGRGPGRPLGSAPGRKVPGRLFPPSLAPRSWVSRPPGDVTKARGGLL